MVTTVKKTAQYVFSVFVFGCGILNTVCAEDACKFSYFGFPEDLNDSFVVVPENVVAMSDFVPVGSPTEIVEQFVEVTPSIIFVIDHSSSMWEPPFSPLAPEPSDRWGARYTVTRALVDTIYKLNPEAQIGLVIFGTYLFFDATDDPLFEKCPAETKGAYLPLLTLNKTYNGKTGYDIVKYYLETDTVTNFFDDEYVDLVHQPTDNGLQTENNSSTNIFAGFEAAKLGMADSPHPKKDHFVIFFSDGEATAPEDDSLKFFYIEGENVPTTFTIYFTPDNQALDNLETMTENIKTNGYSISNPMSNLWAIEAGHDALMKLLMENVIGKIINQVFNAHPITITINGLNPVTTWDSTGFTFNSLFPLLGESTNFDFDISYDIYKDSIKENGDTVSVKVGDTTHQITFDAIIETGAVVGDKIAIECWDRVLGFYHNGTQVNLIDETMANLEIRFTETEIDVLYGYTDVSVVITHTQGSAPLDSETFKLDNQGAYFSGTFAREIADPNTGDGTLQHQSPDSIVAIFRNPKLPLDTLRLAVPFALSGAVAIQTGIYFDNNAEGFVDSIFIGLAGSKIKENLDELMDVIALPPHRDFTVTGYRAVSDGIAVNVKEGTALPQTFVTNEDILEVADTLFLQNGGLLLPTTSPISIIDSMAPVIMKASFVDSIIIIKDGQMDSLTDLGTDELTVVFSESVDDITRDKPFKYFATTDAKEFGAELTLINQNGNMGLFSVDKLFGASSIVDGDSIWINWALADNICDAAGNQQDNSGNVHRRIDVETITIIKKGPFSLIINATMLDPNVNIKLPDYITSHPDIKAILKSVQMNNNGNIKDIMIITLDPDVIENIPDDEHFSATLSLCDAVGNVFCNRRDMIYLEKTKSLIYIWDGRNDNGRAVGLGAYLALAEIDFTTKPDEVLKHLVGVKR